MISILMPVYNAGEYLYKSIGSIQAQTVQDFEIIAVDDGSTDNSLEILQALAREDSRIKIITREEKGYAKTMNEAFDAAIGDYVLNVDPDDWLEPDMFERMLAEMDDDIDFVKCAFRFELPEGDTQEYYYTDEPVEFCPRKLPPDMKMRFFASQIAIWTCLIKRSFIEEHHIRLHETEGAAYQDTAFIFQINSCADKVRVIPDILYHYNKTNMNASTRSTRFPLAPSVEYNWMAKWCEDNPEYGMYVRSVLCKCRFGSYVWNLQRIDRSDRVTFAVEMQKDFQSDWNWIDVRMFSKEEFDIYLIAKNSPSELLQVFSKAMINMTRAKKNTDK
jgi:glycosyltransferase involved in cell wall biosynthesis